MLHYVLLTREQQIVSGLDLASLIPANIEVEATNASVRFSAAKYNDKRAVANGDRVIRNPATILEEDENNPTHAVVNMSELLASSAAAYAHKVISK